MVASQPPAFGNRLAHVFVGHAAPPSTTAKLERKSLAMRGASGSRELAGVVVKGSEEPGRLLGGRTATAK